MKKNHIFCFRNELETLLKADIKVHCKQFCLSKTAAKNYFQLSIIFEWALVSFLYKFDKIKIFQ